MTEAGLPAFPSDVDVAIVSHNGRAILPRVLDRLRAAGAPHDRIAVYDVGSTDGTGEWIATDWPGVTVRRIEKNVGPDPGRNWALREATRPYLLLLDADPLADIRNIRKLHAVIAGGRVVVDEVPGLLSPAVEDEKGGA